MRFKDYRRKDFIEIILQKEREIQRLEAKLLKYMMGEKHE